MKLIALVITAVIISGVLWAQDTTYLSFNGYSSKVIIPYSPMLRSAEQMTLSAWIQTYSSGGEWQSLVWCGSYYENHYAFKITPDNRVRGLIWIGGPITIFSETVLQPDKWYHIAFTYNNLDTSDYNFRLYIDGKLENQIKIHGMIGEDQNETYIGEYPGLNNQHFNGGMRNLQFWSRALAVEEINDKINEILVPVNESGLNGYWRFNEGQGKMLFDHSGNGNNGNIFDALWMPDHSIHAKISVDSTYWPDKDFNGFESGKVDASASTGEIVSYTWSLNGDTISTAKDPMIEVPSGTNTLKLTVRNGYISDTDSVLIHVYCGQYSTNGMIYSAPSQLNSSLFISAINDKVHRFDSTGNSKWTYETGGYVLGTVTAADENNIFVSASDTRLYSFNNAGMPNWDKAIGGVITSAPAISKNEKIIYTGLSSGRLFAIKFNGEALWSFEAGSSVIASAVIDDKDNIYFGCEDKNLYKIDKNGSLLWKNTLPEIIISSPALGKDSSVVVNNRSVYKLNSEGTLLWEYKISEIPSPYPLNPSPIIDHRGNIYIGSSDGWFYSLSPNGNLNWKYFTDAPISSTASISADAQVIYFADQAGSIYALTNTGKLKWVLRTGEPIAAPTLVTVSNTVYSGSISGNVFIIKDIPYEQQAERPFLQWPTFQGNNQRTGQSFGVITAVKEKKAVPESYSIQNYPNPFNPDTKISYSIKSAANVEIKVYNSLGELVKHFDPQIRTAGSYEIEWNAGRAASGIYFCTINAVPVDGAERFNKTIKMVLMK